MKEENSIFVLGLVAVLQESQRSDKKRYAAIIQGISLFVIHNRNAICVGVENCTINPREAKK